MLISRLLNLSAGRRPSRHRNRPRRAAVTSYESLEPRCLLAATVELAADINTVGDSRPSDLIEYDGALYFKASNPSDGLQWWRLDGEGNASLVNDLAPREGGTSTIGGGVVYDSKLYFGYRKNPKTSPLWTVDSDGVFQPGTSEGHFEIDEPSDFAEFQGALYFAGGTSGHRELWRYTATGGHQLVADLTPNSGSSLPEELTVLGDAIFFSANDDTHGRELWRVDATGDVQLVADLAPGAGSSDPQKLTVFDGELYFWANVAGSQTLWKLDSAGELSEASDLRPAMAFDQPTAMKAYNQSLYFFAAEEGAPYRLWKIDTEGVASVASEVAPGSVPPEEMAIYNGALYFRGWDVEDGYELWKLDADDQATRVTNLDSTQVASYTLTSFAVLNNELYFAASSQATGFELWKVDAQGAVALAADLNRGSSLPRSFQAYNNRLYFSAFTPLIGNEIWSMDNQGNAALTVNVSGSLESNPRYFTPFNGDLYFAASGSQDIWRLNAQNQETPVADVQAVPGLPAGFTEFHEELYFTANDGVHGVELWKINPQGDTALVADIFAGSESGFHPSLPFDHIAAVGDSLYFVAYDGVHGDELWKVDPQGDAALFDLRPGSLGSGPSSFNVYNNELYFAADDGVNGRELWKISSDGLPVRVSDFVGGSHPLHLLVLRESLYFVGFTSARGHEWWKMDADGQFTPLAEVNPGPATAFPNWGVRYGRLAQVLGDSIYFTADDGIHGEELWRIGPSDQVELVADIYPGPGHSRADGYTEYNGSLYFAASAGLERGDREVWHVMPGDVAESPWRNEVEPHDVDNDGDVGVNDLLAIVQMLRTHGSPFVLGELEGERSPAYVDVDGDNVGSVNDLLLVVQRLRRDLEQPPAPAPESEPPATLFGASAAETSDDLSPFLLDDDEDPWDRFHLDTALSRIGDDVAAARRGE